MRGKIKMNNKRHNQIIKLINEYGNVNTNDLSSYFNVSIETIRRDLTLLHSKGEIIRKHGGAFAHYDTDEGERFSCRVNVNVNYKMSLVKRAIEHIDSKMTIGLDASSTSWLVAQQMDDIKCTVVTNSVKIINSLVDKKNITIICTGGQYSDKYKAFHGIVAQNVLSELAIDIGFISCSGFDLNTGVWDSNEFQCKIKRAIISSSNKVVLIADSSKYRKKYLMKVCDMSEVDDLITNLNIQ